MPEIYELSLALLLIGVASFGITEVVKNWCRRWVSKEGADPGWWQGLFRLIPISIGTLMGSQFFDWPWGVSLGAAAGVLSVLLNKKARDLIKSIRGPSGQ